MYTGKDVDAVLGNMVAAVNMLQGCTEFAALVPEVRVNLACAPQKAKTPREVAAVEGRITVVCGRPCAVGMPGWGASDHLARRVLEMRKYDPSVNAAINFRYNEDIVAIVREYCAERGLLFGCLDRADEPNEITETDGASMPWKVRKLVAIYGSLPHIYYEGPGWGKEPLFLTAGKDAVEVASIAIDIAQRYCKRQNR